MRKNSILQSQWRFIIDDISFQYSTICRYLRHSCISCKYGPFGPVHVMRKLELIVFSESVHKGWRQAWCDTQILIRKRQAWYSRIETEDRWNFIKRFFRWCFGSFHRCVTLVMPFPNHSIVSRVQMHWSLWGVSHLGLATSISRIWR